MIALHHHDMEMSPLYEVGRFSAKPLRQSDGSFSLPDVISLQLFRRM